jgi:hypothetical protein
MAGHETRQGRARTSGCRFKSPAALNRNSRQRFSAITRSSRGLNYSWWDQFPAAEKFFKRLAEDSVPAFEWGQLLRSFSQLRKKTSDAGQRLLGAVMLAVAAGDRHGGAAGVAGLPADGLKQQWPAGDRFAMMMGVGQAHEQIPPVEEQRDHARNQAAALEIAGRKAAPAPLVLQLIENILDIPFTAPLIS